MATRPAIARISIRLLASSLLLVGVVLAGSAQLTSWLDATPLSQIDDEADRYVNRTLGSAVAMYGVARTINATVSVIQDSEIQATLFGAGASVALGEALDPVNDLIEQFSLVMLYSATAMGVAKVLAKVGPWLGFEVLLPSALFLVVVGLWLPGTWKRKTVSLGCRLLLVSLVVRVAVPAACYVNDGVYSLFLEERYEAAASSVGAEELQYEGEAGVLGRLKDSVLGGSFDFAAKVGRLAKWASDMLTTLIDIMVVFAVQTVVLPLLLLYGTAKIVRLMLVENTYSQLDRIFRGVTAEIQKRSAVGRGAIESGSNGQGEVPKTST